jgi:hypothetical protein
LYLTRDEITYMTNNPPIVPAQAKKPTRVNRVRSFDTTRKMDI